MKIHAFVLGAVILSSFVAQALANDRRVEIQDIVSLEQAGLSDQTILTFVDSGTLGFSMSAADLIYLRDAGVSEHVIRYLLAKARPTVAPVPNPTYRAPYRADYRAAYCAPPPVVVNTIGHHDYDTYYEHHRPAVRVAPSVHVDVSSGGGHHSRFGAGIGWGFGGSHGGGHGYGGHGGRHGGGHGGGHHP